MFYTIHRAFKFLIYGLLLLVGWKIYENRAVFEPAVIWYQVWDNGGFRVEKPQTIGGRAVQVLNSQTFVLGIKRGQRLNVRLMGLKDPPVSATFEAVEQERERMKALEALIKNKWLHVEILYQNANNLGAVVFAGPTNVNATLVLQGHARASKETVRTLPKESQYAILWASRHRPLAQ